ncbi:MAG: sugar transferase [Alphaproteobacteria bacterium]|nr:sugar transferase [Alphaproteobacteria bacterium]
MKRAVDVVVALGALVVLLPVFAMLAVAIKLDSRGPVFFRQCRIGLGGVPFRVFKFRTMRVLEDGDRIPQTFRNDPRVTRIGAFLRSSSLDEIPQLLNVLSGEMSLVGPRPHARAHDEEFERLLPNYAQRRSVKPGLTGWAQIHGLRGPTPTLEAVRRRTDFDLWYARHASLALDLHILAATPREIVFPRNAL